MTMSPSETLLSEFIAFLDQRQLALRARFADHARRADARAEAGDRRHAQIEQRLGLLETRLSGSGPRPIGRPLLRVEGLAKEIGGVDILRDINFEIYEHEILGLIGPNGAGKTTLLECLAGLQPRTAGVFYEGLEAPPDWDPRGLLFYLPNGVAPYAEFYAIEVLTFFGRMYEVEPLRFERIIVEELSLLPVLQKKVHALSKGNLQRLLIALALMSPQPLLALDEPFDGLDIHQTHAMMGILRGLRAHARTLLLCIHQLTDAERICDRLLLLSGGRIVGIGTLAQLRSQAGLSEGSLEDIFMSLTDNSVYARSSGVLHR